MSNTPVPGVIYKDRHDVYHLFDANLQHLETPRGTDLEKLKPFAALFATSRIQWKHHTEHDYPQLEAMGAPFPKTGGYMTNTITDISSAWSVAYDPLDGKPPPGINPYYI